MDKIDTKELMAIVGGISITGTLISAITKGITTVFDLGRSLGTSIRRAISNSVCSI